ncbi:MAG: efflux RND transporter periplasmic adaptor subunit [Acidobacteria bacterium]|nr:efflux RND transporter periplasmic adaptor subunit [Acidobacteriota bacterium]
MTMQGKNPLEEKENQQIPSSEGIGKHAGETSGFASLREHETGRSHRLRKILLIVVVILTVASAGLYFGRDRLSGTWVGKLLGGNADHRHAQGETYYCPMHTNYKSDKPGNCPICSMKLVKLESAPGSAEGKTAGDSQSMPGMPAMEMPSGAETETAPGAPTANAIFIAPERQQLIGVRSVPAALKPLVKEIRAVGKVAYDETKLTHIHTKVNGYIEEVFVDYVGKVVKKGDPLFTIYSPELVATQEEYLLALRGQEYLGDSSFDHVARGSKSLLEATRKRLLLWDITEEEIEILQKEGKAKRELTIYSPVSGIVTERAAYHHGRYVNPEMDLYTIVDLSTVWVIAEVYEYELPFVKVGQTAEIEFPYTSRQESLRGKVTYLYPYLDPKTRTAKVRFEFLNPDFVLKPDMFFNVKLKINLGEQLVVPEDAVLDTGTEQYVFVDKGDGYFEPRAVQLSAEAGGYYAIESGLKPGERVVTAANFILDSESRLKGAFANMGKPGMQEMSKATAPASNLKIELMEPKLAKVGQNTIRLVVKDASGNPVTDAEVEVTLFMPQMGSMAPMTSKAMLNHLGNGEYAGTIDIAMAWTWQTTVTVKRAGQTLGSMQTNITAR